MSSHKLRWTSPTLLVFILSMLLGACSTPAAPTTPDRLEGGVLATFDVSGERFHAWVTNPQTIQQLEELQQGTSLASILNGRILRGAGEATHNVPWSWHLDPQDIEMAEVTTEVCDAAPSYVEENVDEFVDNVQRYCPWNAELVELQDYR